MASTTSKIRSHPFFQYFFKNKLIILMYHGVLTEPLSVPDWCFIDSRNFFEQMRYLKTYFDVLPLSQAVKKLKAGNIQDPTVSITFDDGFMNNYDVAYPITSELKVPITIYVSTRFVDRNCTLWYCRINAALSRTSKRHLTWRRVRYSIENIDQKSRFSSLVQRELKKMTQGEMIQELDNIINALGVKVDAELNHNSPFRMLNSEAIRRMSQSEYVEIGAHTDSHAILSKLSPLEKRNEILYSIRAVENWTRSRCQTFAYPNGRPRDYDEECIKLLKDYNIETAVTGKSRRNTPETSPFELGRYGIGSNMSMDSFKLVVHGISPLVSRFASKLLS